MPRGGKRANPGGRPKSENPKIYSVLLKTVDGTYSKKLTGDQSAQVKQFIENLGSDCGGKI